MGGSGTSNRYGKEMCVDFQRGDCRRGDRCRYSHGEAPPSMVGMMGVPPMMPPMGPMGMMSPMGMMGPAMRLPPWTPPPPPLGGPHAVTAPGMNPWQPPSRSLEHSQTNSNSKRKTHPKPQDELPIDM